MSTPRRYDSERRSEQARQTRLAIRGAARELFERDGFARTTVAAVARRAGVSVPTVYASFGNKSGLLRAMMDELEDHAAQGEDVATELFAEHDPARQLALFVHWIRTLFERGAPLLRMAREARTDPDVEAMITTGNDRRLEGTTMLTAGWDAAGGLRPGLTAEAAAQTLWLLTTAELYFNATEAFGWDADAYEAWVTTTATAALLRSDT